MAINPIEWLTFAEKLLNKAIGIGISLLVLAGTFLLAYRSELITPSDTTKLAYDICQIVATLSAALFVLGMAIWVFRAILGIISWPFAAVAGLVQNHTDRAVLVQNYSLLTRESQVTFLSFLEYPSGRFRSPGNTNQIIELTELALIRPDNRERPANAFSGVERWKL